VTHHSFYSRRGKKTTAIQIHEDDVTDICVMDIKRMHISNALLVALHSGEVSLQCVLSFSDDISFQACHANIFSSLLFDDR
jgi:hypothetical protein